MLATYSGIVVATEIKLVKPYWRYGITSYNENCVMLLQSPDVYSLAGSGHAHLGNSEKNFVPTSKDHLKIK